MDLGVGIPHNVRSILNYFISSSRAIDWSTREHNTTRHEGIPGGAGLHLLCKFLDLNQGSIQILSGTGYWQRCQKRTKLKDFEHPFPGTTVCIEINTSDPKSYILSSERK